MCPARESIFCILKGKNLLRSKKQSQKGSRSRTRSRFEADLTFCLRWQRLPRRRARPRWEFPPPAAVPVGRAPGTPIPSQLRGSLLELEADAPGTETLKWPEQGSSKEIGDTWVKTPRLCIPARRLKHREVGTRSHVLRWSWVQSQLQPAPKIEALSLESVALGNGFGPKLLGVSAGLMELCICPATALCTQVCIFKGISHAPGPTPNSSPSIPPSCSGRSQDGMSPPRRAQ